uniref:Tudor domain containing 6 n=1 Tax=Chelonoidis abingdonii TaxID=106734 RepID=A0A8C0IRY2_CHEAB
MCSVQGIPSPGTTISLRVSFVDVHPEVPLVRLWGLLGERREEYARLHQDIQGKAGPRLVGAPGAVWPAAGAELCSGDLCLVELGDRWHRCRVVSRQGQHCRVFLLDEGRTVAADAYYLARGRDEFFHLPSEVLGCLLADLVPPGAGAAGAGGGEQPAASWSVGALEFLSYLNAKEVSGLVREVLMPQRLVLLELPWLLAQMHHLGLAKQVTPSCFRALAKRCLAMPRQPKPEPPGPTSAQQYPVATTPQPGPAALDFFYPRLQLGVTEPVLVTQISDPHRIYCQLQSLSQEIQRLSDSLHQIYEMAARQEQDPLPKPGSPCAARGIDGRWYRALLLEIFPGEQSRLVAQVICVDYGRNEFVTGANLRCLPLECFRMPVVTYPCSLQGISDGGCGWSRSQLSGLKALLLGKAVSARIEAYSPFEHLYYVNLYGENGLNLNCLYGVQTRCLAHRLLQGGQGAQERPEEEDAIPPKELGPPPDTLPATAAPRDPAAAHLPGVRVKVGVFYHARVSFIRDPSEFWLRLKEHLLPFSQLMRSMSDFYSRAQKLDVIVLEPQPRALCCAKWKENAYCRAVITSVLGNGVEVHLVDRGNREILDWYEVKELLPQFRELPAVALKCCLADVCPLGETWSKEAVAHFKRTVQSKELVIQVLGTQGDKHVIEVFDQSQTGEKNIKNLCSINANFLKLKAQAFRCSLYNLIQPNGPDPFVWDEKAILAFQEFVDRRADHLELKCTIFALAAINNKELFNVVDLITPFQSVCHFLTEKGLARPVPPQKPLASSIQLHSYYYSSHDIKIGSEEEIYVTHVDNPWKFYCQLARSADVLEQLTNNIGRLSKVLHSLKMSQNPGNLYLARYTDNHWYRGAVLKTKPNKEVFFVDFGNTQVVKKEDLIPVPNDAYDILLLPMQAIKCSLSDISNVPKEATTWFETAVLDKPLKMIVVAKESDGKLIIELYDGNIQINAKMKEGLSLPRNRESNNYVENETLHSKNINAKEERNENMKSSAPYMKQSENKTWRSELQGEECNTKTSFVCKDVKHFQPAAKRELSTKFLGSVERFNSNNVFPSASTPLVDKKVGENKSLLFIKKEIKSDTVKADTVKTRNQGENSTLFPLKSLCDLPARNLVPGLKTLVYISHVNNPSDFYIQLASDEPQLNSISEGLNNKTGTEGLGQQQVQVGDLICAVFSEDGLWYRAVVKEKLSDEQISVQYIDYGNTSVVNICETSRLLEKYSSVPMMSINSSLAGVQSKQFTNWTQEAVSYFSERTSEVQINCEFVEKLRDRWEIVLYDEKGVIAVDLINETFGMREESQSTEALDRRESGADVTNQCEPLPFDENNKASSIIDTKSFFWKTPEVAQTVETYVTVVKGPEYFWCQMADPENINYLEKKLQEAGELEISNVDDFRSSIRSGDICIAKYSEDGKFYRAKVSSIKDNNLTVRHVDYGSEELVGREMIRQIPDLLLTIPMQAFPCCLSGFNSPEGSWSNEAKDKFYDMTAEYLVAVTVMEIQKDNSSEIPLSVVKVECNGKNINEEMKCFWKYNTDMTLANVQNDLSEKNEAETPLLKKESDSKTKIYVEPKTSEPQLLASSETKGLDLEPFEAQFLEDDELKAEMLELSPEVQSFLGEERKELLKLPSAEVQPFLDENVKLLELKQLQMHSSLDELKKLLLELESLEGHPSLGDKTKEEVLELESLEMQTSWTDETKEKLSELESLQVQLLDDETGEVMNLKSLEVSPSFSNRQNWLEMESSLEIQPVCEDERGKLFELIPCEVQISLGEETKERVDWDLDLLEVHQMKAAPTELEVESSLVKTLLKGFAVGSKCMVWTCLKWCEARILEISDEGTKVLNLSTGHEEIVNPENVWNGIPEVTKSPYEVRQMCISLQMVADSLSLSPVNDCFNFKKPSDTN